MDETVANPPELKALHPLEVHYFRVPRERWELMLARARQMGADAVSSIVPCGT
jgi:beta-galactosidase GanA